MYANDLLSGGGTVYDLLLGGEIVTLSETIQITTIIKCLIVYL